MISNLRSGMVGHSFQIIRGPKATCNKSVKCQRRKVFERLMLDANTSRRGLLLNTFI